MIPAESSKSPSRLSLFELKHFAAVGLVWLLAGEVLCWFLIDFQEEKWRACGWMAGLWGLSVLDLWVLARLVTRMLQIGQSPAAGAIQALFWGGIKIVCLGLFLIVLLKGQQIPLYGLLLGMGTLGVIPLMGGVLWSQRVLRNA